MVFQVSKCCSCSSHRLCDHPKPVETSLEPVIQVMLLRYVIDQFCSHTLLFSTPQPPPPSMMPPSFVPPSFPSTPTTHFLAPLTTLTPSNMATQPPQPTMQ
ncbi:hypothetical protein L208DRAFT_614604 [Tricholoma matsutake]|nr:hypothetical protein L208DRAFT_614604 [Tricholoma matsutake 945]